MKSFDELFRERDWRPIRNCPGRYILHGASDDLSLAEILGEAASVSEHRVAAARDTVLVVALEDGGGLISYARRDGTMLHTLNTSEGFERKLRQLRIERKG
ncbi:MAG: hypothetical protein ICV60_14800 [Pyrinomonadaceae bacterium]|nr:hypothetical protein [Pyrinomonadaceae bacterium]